MIKIDLYFGDCLKGLDILKEKGIIVDVNLSDLPYGTTKCKWDTPINLGLMWEKLKYITKANTPHLLFAQTPFDKVLGCSNLPMMKYEWVWEKTSATGHLNAKKAPMKAHENILVFYEKQPYYNPQKTTGHVRKVSTASHKRNTKDSLVYNKSTQKTTYDSTERYPRSTLRFPSDKQKSNLHETQKPIALIRYFLKTYGEIGNTILDLTYGSGTTAIGCIEECMNFVGFENDIEAFQKAVYRVEQHIKGNNLQDKVQVNINRIDGNI